MTTESIPSFDLATHTQFREDGDYLSSIWPQVRKKYPDSYVAVYKGTIVATHKTLKGVLKEMDNKGSAQEPPSSDTRPRNRGA